jgi:hypothetical protein
MKWYWKTVVVVTFVLSLIVAVLWSLSIVAEYRHRDWLAEQFVDANSRMDNAFEYLERLDNRRVYPGMPTQLSKTYYKPVAIMGINFGEKVEDFRPGQHYVLKVFYVEGSEVAFGFSQIEVEGPPK